MPRYRKKPVEVFAHRYNGTNADWIMHWADARFIEITTRERDPDNPNEFIKIQALAIKTLEGDMLIAPGDYVIQGVQGEFYPCKPDIFEATYEEVDGDEYPHERRRNADRGVASALRRHTRRGRAADSGKPAAERGGMGRRCHSQPRLQSRRRDARSARRSTGGHRAGSRAAPRG